MWQATILRWRQKTPHPLIQTIGENKMTDDKYPNGKLNNQDEGTLAVKVGIESGAVRIDFAEPTDWFAMTPEMAIDFAT